MRQANIDVVARFAEEFKNRGNHAIVHELFSDDFTHHFPDPRLPPGKSAMLGLGAAVLEAFPDVRATVHQLLADGDYVVERTSASGTHRGAFQGIEATGRTVSWTETHVYRLRDGKIAELWPQIHMLSVLAQLGALGG